MSRFDAAAETTGRPARERDGASGNSELTSARLARVGDIDVRRLLPMRRRRAVGAWCFVDHYGPMSVDGVAGMRVPPHPHIGLQTVTWLIEGDVLHRDSLGTEQMISPGQLIVSPARVFSPLVGAEIGAPGDARGSVPLAPAHEHVLFAARGSAHVDGVPGVGENAASGSALVPGSLLYLGVGRESVTISAAAGARLLLLGGEPLGETLLIWWNFVGRTPEDISAAVADWQRGERFGAVSGYRGAPLSAPPLNAARLRSA